MTTLEKWLCPKCGNPYKDDETICRNEQKQLNYNFDWKLFVVGLILNLILGYAIYILVAH